MGTMAPHKGAHVLLDALKRLRTRDFRATFIGSSAYMSDLACSPYERRLRDDSADLGGRVSFEPYALRDYVPARYRDHDILVVPSQFDDPCPLVLLEGMASGLAVVCSGRGGMRQVGAHAVQYALTPATFAEVIESLVSDAGLRAEWGRRARARAEQLSWSSSFDELSRIVLSDEASTLQAS
jgi:glycosyltransferase involved in cell wall biosynthesis